MMTQAKKFAIILILVLLACLPANLTAAQPATSGPSRESVQSADPTPTPAAAGQDSARSFPWLGILVLLAPAAWMAWQKSRPGANSIVTAVSCVPVIDEDKRLLAQKDDGE